MPGGWTERHAPGEWPSRWFQLRTAGRRGTALPFAVTLDDRFVGHVMIGNVDCRILTFGTREAIEAEVRRCAAVGKPCPGYFFAVGNHIPYNIPIENVELYFDLINRLGRR